MILDFEVLTTFKFNGFAFGNLKCESNKWEPSRRVAYSGRGAPAQSENEVLEKPKCALALTLRETCFAWQKQVKYKSLKRNVSLTNLIWMRPGLSLGFNFLDCELLFLTFHSPACHSSWIIASLPVFWPGSASDLRLLEKRRHQIESSVFVIEACTHSTPPRPGTSQAW